MKAFIPLAASLLPTLGGPNMHKHLNGRFSLQARGWKTDRPTDSIYCWNWAGVILLSQAFASSQGWTWMLEREALWKNLPKACCDSMMIHLMKKL